MPNFQIYLPHDILESLDNERGSTARSRIIRELVERCIKTPGYIQEVSQSITKE